jgi:hypothetical protein
MRSLIADQRGAIAFEVPAIWMLLMLSVLLPLADVAVASMKFIAAKQALRNYGQYLQYNPPPDVTNLNSGSWLSTAQSKKSFDARFTITDPQVLCNGISCTDPTVVPKSYSYSTTVTLTPIVPLITRPLLCTSTNNDPCTFTMSYSERFQ